MKIDVAFYDDDIAFEKVLTLLRSGDIPHVQVTLGQHDNRLRYELRGEIDEGVIFEQALRATPIRKGRPSSVTRRGRPLPPPPDPFRVRQDPFEEEPDVGVT